MRARTAAEIVRLVAEFHTLLLRNQADQIGAIYARYSSRYQDSIVDQVRTLLQEAHQKKIFAPAEFIIYDMSVRGDKYDCEGLNGLPTSLEK